MLCVCLAQLRPCSAPADFHETRDEIYDAVVITSFIMRDIGGINREHRQEALRHRHTFLNRGLGGAAGARGTVSWAAGIRNPSQAPPALQKKLVRPYRPDIQPRPR